MAQTTTTTAFLPSGEFSVGDVISKSLSLFFQRPIRLFLITFAAWLPIAFIGAAFAAMGVTNGFQGEFAGRGQIPQDAAPVAMILGLLSVVAFVVYSGLSCAITTHVVLSDLRQTPVNGAVSRGVRRLPSLFVMLALAGLATILGLALLVAPGLMLMAMWAVAIPVCAYEKLGPAASLKRSASLTKGSRWRLFALIILFFGTSIVIALAQRLGLFILGPLAFAAGVFAKLVLTTIYNVCVAVAYHRLRVINEGVDLEDVAAVFD